MKEQVTKEVLQQFYMECLAVEGFRPAIDQEGDVAFKFEGLSFYIRPHPEDEEFHVIVMPGIFTIESERLRQRAQLAALKLVGDYKVAKVKIFKDHVWLTVELFLPDRESFARIFMRCLHVLRDVRTDFIEAMRDPPEPPPSLHAREDALGPAGTQSLTCGGAMTIDRPVLTADPITDAFEVKFLDWLVRDLKLKPISHAGSGALFWRVEFAGRLVDIGIVGRLRSPAVPLAPGLDWLMRIEEEEPTEFISLVEKQFMPVERVRRHMHGGKIRVQFKSTELGAESLLA